MELSGNLIDIQQDFISGDVRIILTVREKDTLRQGYEGLREALLDIKIDKHREKRSLNANAYFHVLSGKIAEKLTISKAKAKNILLAKYGQPLLLEDGSAVIYKTNAPVEYMCELEDPHTTPIKYEEKATFYKVIRGSHTYDSKEMSVLIDGTVADAKELGIETLTPEELERMVKAWQSQ